VGTDVFALIAEWEPMVAGFRGARGLGFYRDANVAHNDAFRAAQAAGRARPEPPERLEPRVRRGGPVLRGRCSTGT
jgi:hypothetical protein